MYTMTCNSFHIKQPPAHGLPKTKHSHLVSSDKRSYETLSQFTRSCQQCMFSQRKRPKDRPRKIPKPTCPASARPPLNLVPNVNLRMYRTHSHLIEQRKLSQLLQLRLEQEPHHKLCPISKPQLGQPQFVADPSAGDQLKLYDPAELNMTWYIASKRLSKASPQEDRQEP